MVESAVMGSRIDHGKYVRASTGMNNWAKRVASAQSRRDSGEPHLAFTGPATIGTADRAGNAGRDRQ
jgi:hypothetical protein